MSRRDFWAAALIGGTAAALLDIVYAFVWLGINDRSPLWVLQSVASGWLGRGAFTGGWSAGARTSS